MRTVLDSNVSELSAPGARIIGHRHRPAECIYRRQVFLHPLDPVDSTVFLLYFGINIISGIAKTRVLIYSRNFTSIPRTPLENA